MQTADPVAAPDSLAPSPQAPAPRQHLDFLDGIRGLAALFVVVHHAWLQTWPVLIYENRAPSGLTAVLTDWLYYGHFAVTVFITLSGFCLMIPVIRTGTLRGGAKGFLWGRVRRILPPYYAALLLSIIVARGFLQTVTGTLYDASLPVTMHSIVMHALLIHNLAGSVIATINGPLWSVAVEFQIYLLFPFFVLLLRKRGIVAVMAVAAVLATALWIAVHHGPRAGLTPHYIFIFTIGMLSALQAFRSTAAQIPARIIQGVALASALLILAMIHHYPRQTRVSEDILVGLLSGCMLTLILRNPKHWLRRIAEFAPLVWVGGFSYSLYLIHFPLQQLFWQLAVQGRNMPATEGFLLVATIGTVILVALSYVFYRLIERPFMRSKPRA